ncbi:MAG: LuxR C-terminal-related transcriptional regulator [Halanaerobium sp.]|nr:LuxR C-terminal-related transcriptional regulator [Halanaerobium sp.]
MMLFKDEEYLIYYQLVELLYGSRDIKELQNIIMGQVHQLVPFDSSILLFYRQDGFTVESSIIHNLDPARFTEYRDHYQDYDLYKQQVHKLDNPPIVNRASDFLAYDTWAHNEHRNDFLLPQNIYHLSCLEIVDNDKILTSFSFHRSKTYEDFSDREIHILYLLAPVIKSVYSTLTSPDLYELADESNLTAREKQILPLLLSRYSNEMIADHCGVSINTMKTHIRNILRKLECSSRNDLLFKVNGDYNHARRKPSGRR